MIKQIGKIAVLLGGPSSERDISIKSGTAVYEALKSLGLDIVCIDPSYEPIDQIRKIDAEAAFIALHGRFGEDGYAQSILEAAGIAYTGSGPTASRLAMDKIASRAIFQKAAIPAPKYVTLSQENAEEWYLKDLSFPIVVKPNREGSSIGLTVARDRGGAIIAISKAFEYDFDVLLEEFIPGEDITIGILDNRPLPVVHIKPKYGIYDFNAKYTQGLCEYIVPAKLDRVLIKKAQETALKAHELLGCRDFSRVDMRLDRDGNIFVLEVNTIPGLTSTSLLPKAAKADGIDFAQLCLRVVEMALNRKDKYGKEEIIKIKS